jgi:hypothetical protein
VWFQGRKDVSASLVAFSHLSFAKIVALETKLKTVKTRTWSYMENLDHAGQDRGI